MSERTEKDVKVDEKQPRQDKKDPIKIRISIFYDGTNNNRDNIEEREKNSEIYEKYRNADGSGSYDNGRTNIAIMEPHVSGKKEVYKPEYDLAYKFYIAGQGPVSRGADQILRGVAMAIGVTGVPSRAEEGIDKAVEFILTEDKDLLSYEKHYIEKLTIDVFGFSRGAATARYAIHVIHEGRMIGYDEDTGKTLYEWYPLFQRLNDFKYEITKAAVEVQFAGLYDTVLSYIGSQKLPKWMANNILEQRAVARANKSLHLAAAEEHRADFPLHMIKSAGSKGNEYYLPGVHSDVGGSYNKADELKLKDDNIPDKVYMIPNKEGTGSIDDNPLTRLGFIRDEAMVINDNDPKTVRQDRDDLIAQGWYKENEIKVHDVSWDESGVTRSILAVSRQNISSAYSNIPLKIMAKAAREEKLQIDTELELRANKILESDTDLQKLEGIIEEYIGTHKDKNTSTPEHWLTPEKKDVDELLKTKIRNRHFHFSASKMSLGYGPRFEYDKTAKKKVRKRFYYEG